jgi:hypothetical protein
MAIFDRDNLSTFGTNDIPLVAVQVCWNCEYLQAQLGRFSSGGPTCGECGDRLDTYKVVG